MTIKEIEERSGMTRANIRFYESEGLLNPERKENGYRDYSGDDLETLLRIRLLRSLGVPLDDIRALQSGGMELSDALREQLDALAVKQTELERSGAVCREMLDDGAEYASLDAQRYLDALSRETPAAVPEDDALPKLRAPWRRYFARSFDIAACAVVLQCLLVLAFHVNVRRMPRLAELVVGWAGALMQVYAEPLFLSRFGTTPGKRLFGIRVTGVDGQKLTYREALTRTVCAWGRGMGYSIPVYNLVRLYKSFQSCDAGKTLDWEGDSVETARDDKAWRWIGYLAARAAVIALLAAAVLVTELPKHRGDLTVAEVCENYNRIVDYYEPDLRWRLSDKGVWVTTDYISTGSAVSDSLNVHSVDYPRPSLKFSSENGFVTGVSFEQTLENASFPPSYCKEAAYLTLAFAGAQEGAGLLRTDARGACDLLQQNAYTNYTDEVYGVRIERRLDYSGYEDFGISSMLQIEPGGGTVAQSGSGETPLWPKDGEEKYYMISFSLLK